MELGQTERQQSWPTKAKRAKKKGNNGRQNSIPAPAMECSWKSDNVLGPIVSSCRGGFDFTLLFEQAIFSTIPSVLLLIACAWRLRRIYRWPQKTASSFSTALKYCKQVWEGTYIPQEFFLTLFTDRFLFGALWPHSWPLLFCGRHLNFTRPEYRWRHQHYLSQAPWRSLYSHFWSTIDRFDHRHFSVSTCSLRSSWMLRRRERSAYETAIPLLRCSF